MNVSRNPYHVDSQPPTLRWSVFAFMDILGYTTLIKQAHETGNQANVLKAVHRALSSGRRWIDNDEPRADLAELIKRDPYALRTV
jgi:hypothetical protein